MKNFALALLLTALAGCGSSSSPSVQTPVEPTENNTGIVDLVCFIVSLFNPACFDRDGVVVPTDPENLTPTLLIESRFGCNLRVSWTPSSLPGITHYKIMWTMFPELGWSSAGFQEIGVDQGVLNWEITLPQAGLWYLSIVERFGSTEGDQGRTSRIEIPSCLPT